MARSLDGISNQPVNIVFYPIKPGYRWGLMLLLVGVGLFGLASWRVVGFRIENQRILYPSAARNEPATTGVESEQLFSPYFYETSAPVLADPASLSLPSQGIQGEIVPVGLTNQGAIAAPEETDQIGWYSLGARLGQGGIVALVGHKDDVWFRPAVFAQLDKVVPGDLITLTDELGRSWDYVVEQSEVYPTNDLPLDQLFQSDNQARLVIISCAGRWSWLRGSYSERIVISAVPR